MQKRLKIKENFYLVKPVGFAKMTQEEYTDYVAMSKYDRLQYIWGIKFNENAR